MNPNDNTKPPIRGSLRIAIIFAAISICWIPISDQLLYHFITDPVYLTKAQTIKGWLFVIATSLLIYCLLRREIGNYFRAEKALKQSKEQYEALIKTSIDGFNVIDIDGKLVDVNDAYCNMVGYKRETLLAMNIQDIDCMQTPGEVNERFQNVLAKGFDGFQTKHRTLSGRIIDVEVSAVGLASQGIILCFIHDITDRRRAEMALLESERRFRLVLEKIALVGVMLDRKGHITLANDCLLDLTGWTRGELLGRSWFEIFLPAEIRSEIESLFFNTIETGRFPKRYENEILTCKGEKRLIAWNNTVVRDETDRIVGVTSVGEDITVRKQVNEKLRQTERKYRELAESLPQVIFEIDSKANLIYLNRTGYDLFGYTPEDFVNGINVLEAFIPEDRERVARDFKLNFQGQRLGRQDYTAIKKDGTKFPVGVHANRVMSGAAATGVRGILIDLTLIQQAEAEKKKLEAQLQQAQKIEAIGVLAGGIAHDFNNILSVIIGNADILEISSSVSQADMPCVQQILAAGERAKQLVKQILAFSRRGEQQRLLVNLKLVVRETVNFLKSTLPSSIEVSQNFQADAGAAILGDPTQMQQVLMNLCTNGAHAMENQENGVLEIGLEKMFLSEEEAHFQSDVDPGEFVKMTVKDNGVGIEPSVLERIFEPYFTTKEPGKGTGLGLSVVHGIVKSHGGFIKVYSEPGKGTCFHVFFPVASEGNQPAAAPEARRLPGGSETLLLVDDEKILVDMTQQMLERLGYRAETRSSPLEAIEAFRANPDRYHAVITDMTMPQMNGISLSKKLLEIRGNLPILLCTGFSDQTNEKKARAAGVREFAFKPLALSDLAKTLRKMLDEAKAKNIS